MSEVGIAQSVSCCGGVVLLTLVHCYAELVLHTFWNIQPVQFDYFVQGIVRALREYQKKLIDGHVSIFVRRAGPNYQEGLRVMRELGKIYFRNHLVRVHLNRLLRIVCFYECFSC